MQKHISHVSERIDIKTYKQVSEHKHKYAWIRAIYTKLETSFPKTFQTFNSL